MIKPVRWKTRFDLIPSEDIRAIHEASLRIMERTGLLMPLSPEREEEAQDLGLFIDRKTQRIHFPPALVEATIQTAPRCFKLCARNPENDLLMDGRHGYLSVDGSVTDILDLDSGEPRPSSKADLLNIVRLADALPEISFLWPAVSARDCAPEVQPLHEIEALLTWSSKHAQAMTAVDPLNARGTIEMAAEVVGGPQNLRARPIISNFQCSISPLSYERKTLEAAFIFGAAGVPTGFVVMTIGCATAPATVAGNIALANAEALAGITLFELFFPGVPTFYGACGTMMELRTGGVTCGGPEDLFLQAAGCQLARFYGLPASIGTFATGAKMSDWHAGVENALSGAVSQFCGADMMSGAGLLGAARVFSFEQLLLDCEIYDLIRRVAQGFEVDEEALALDSIHEVGPRNHHMTTKHTRTHLREVWQPMFMQRGSWQEGSKREKPGSLEKAKAKAQEILSSHWPDPLPCSLQLNEIIDEYAKKAQS